MNSKIGRDAALLTASKFITMIISLLSAMLIARFRTLEENGTYSQLMLVIGLVSTFFSLGLPNSTNFFLSCAENQKERKHFLSVYFTIFTILCFSMGGILVLTLPFIVEYFENGSICNYVFFLFFYPWAYGISSSIDNILIVYGKTGLLIIFNISRTAVALVSMLIVEFFKLSFYDYMIIFLAGNIIIMAWSYIIIWSLADGLYVSLNRQLMRQIFVYCVPIGIAGVVGTLNIEIDKLMIGHFFSTEKLAIYTNAAKELPLSIIASSLTAVLLPQIARHLKEGRNDEAIKLWSESVEFCIIILSFFVMVLIVFAPQIINILYSEKYISGVTIFRIYSFVLLLRCTYFGMILSSVGKTKLILLSSIISLVANIALNCILFMLLGMIGPAVATFLSILLAAFVQLYYSARELGTTLKRIFPWIEMLIVVGINCILGVILWIIVKLMSIDTSLNSILISILICCIASVIYIIVMAKPLTSIWRKLNE